MARKGSLEHRFLDEQDRDTEDLAGQGRKLGLDPPGNDKLLPVPSHNQGRI